MASSKGILINALGRLVLRDTTIRSICEITEHMRVIELQGAGLHAGSWTAGDKIQVLLPSLEMRTYTPTRWAGTTELLVYHHGDTPGAMWSKAAKAGDRCRFVGPQSSLRWDPARPAVLFGDETSFAVAQALQRTPGSTVSFVFEVGSQTEAERVIAATGLRDATIVERVAGDRHLPTVASHLRGSLARDRTGQLLLTGRAQSIQSVRAELRADGPRPYASKAYWAVGKVGLD